MAVKAKYTPSIKVVVTGPFNAGKTTLVRTLTEISIGTERPLSRPEERAVKSETTVGLDFGLVNLGDGHVVRLFGTPGQRRFSFMWKILSVGMHGYILMVDSTDEESIMESGRIYQEFKSISPGTPHVISANKQDMPNALSPDDIRIALDLPEEAPIVPTVAKDHSSAWETLRTLLRVCAR
ncbi:MAG: ADP-ribosylation factor-like protein [Aigarchaeota archaeon]|nr:ADP-ribosylation factor-like protein [Aigarchaeota archaeon]MDW8092489.1 ADP-ribosylation factor-like protein [Nitrososphaerota archaeon]